MSDPNSITELKPCPFCGCNAPHPAPRCGFPVSVWCPSCGATGPEKLNGLAADNAWNDRRESPQQQKLRIAADKETERASFSHYDAAAARLRKAREILAIDPSSKPAQGRVDSALRVVAYEIGRFLESTANKSEPK